MSKCRLYEKALSNLKVELVTPKLQRLGKVLLNTHLFRSEDENARALLNESDIVSEEVYRAALIECRAIYENQISRFPLLTCLALDVKVLPKAIDQTILHKLNSTIFFASISEQSVFNPITVAEAADKIRLILSNRAYLEKLAQIPTEISLFDTLEFVCNKIGGQYIVSNAYFKMVMNGWSVCSDYKDESSVVRKSKIRQRRPNSVTKPLVHKTPFPFTGNDLDIEDTPDVETVELDQDTISPTIKAERELFRNQILTSKEQFGLAFVTYRLTPLELDKAIQWINYAQPTASSALGFLTILTTLKLHEVLGLHLALAESDADAFKQSDSCYGIIDLASARYWRKGLDIADRYEPNSEDQKWLLPHTDWLALPIPNQFLHLLRAFFAGYQAGLIEQVLPDDVSQKANDLLTQACREIVLFGDLNRRLTHKTLRYLLYGCMASKYGRHRAALIFANNEFGLSTWHYYMSDTAHHSQLSFIKTCIESLGFGFDHQVDLSKDNFVIGSKLSINKAIFSERLAERVELLNASLRSVGTSRSLDALREIYNQLVSYTVLMFSAVTSHRRNKSMFIEHYCWNEDYTSVLIADKIHFGESATRIIPVPELMTRQVQNTLGWIEQIFKRVKLLDKKIAILLKSSIHRDSKAPFLGLWQDNGTFAEASTAQVEVFMGEGWPLPQNAIRQLSYQMLFSYEDATPFLDHQMGHISTDMHSFQNTSLMQYGGSEVEIHRNSISRCLDELGFSLLARTSFSHSKMYNNGQFVPTSIQKKSRNQSKNAETKIQSDLRSLLDEAIKTNQDFYELLSEKYRDDPYLHEQTLILLKALKLSDGEQTIINSDELHSALGRYLKKSPVASTVLPYGVMFSERNYTQIHSTFCDFAQALITHPKQVSSETLGNILLFFMILDGTGDLSAEMLRRSVTISSVKYSNGYLTAKINEKLVFFGGLSALFLAMLIKRGEFNNVTLNPQILELFMNGNCPEVNVDKSIASGYAKLSALFRQMHDKEMTFSKLYQLIDLAPRRSETGALYGLRQGTLRVKGLSEHTLLRLLDRKHRYIIPSSDEAKLSAIAERSFFKAKPRSNDYFKTFMADFRNKFVKYPGTSKEKITRFWQELISFEKAINLSDLVKRSHDLPEITVLVLTWLYEISGRKGQRYGGLAPSSIQTYFSKVVPRLFEFAANQSLTTFDYEDFSDLYQDIIDAGDIENRADRAKILARFHSVIQEYFGVVKFDFRDLDVEENEESLTGRIIMPWEYEQALSLLLSDKDMNAEEQWANAAILILCCRLGLRREEIRRLKLRDFSVEEQVLYVRTHRISKETVRVKSKSGNRRIPYSLFLNEQEIEILYTCIEKAKGQKSQSVPLFFDLTNPKEIRHMDSHFSRVIEALKLVTGDPEMRLHDGRHTCISFIATALILNDKQRDPIAKVVKAWIGSKLISEFQRRFCEATVATPTTRHALLPALALMIGHSSATTTLSSYIHLMDYWRWLAVEENFKSVKKLDGVLARLIRVPRKRFIELKSEQGLSASYVVLKKTQKESLPVGGAYQIESFDRKPELSPRDKNSIATQILQIQRIEKALRYLEDAERQSNEAPDASPIKPSDHHYELTQHHVDTVRSAYQAILTNDVSYRAYEISSNEEGVDFIGQSRLYEARNYVKDADFYQLLIHLIQCKQESSGAFTALMQLWQQAWYDAKKKMFIPTFQMKEANAAFIACQLRIELSTRKMNRRVGGAVFESCAVEQLTMQGEIVSIPQFSHAMFLLKLLEKH